MANRERPEPPERGSLRWRILAREKFFWKAGDIRLVHEGKGREEAPARGPDGVLTDAEGSGRG